MIFPQVLATEFLKLRRSKVTWLSFVALSLAPLGIALMMWIVREPGRAAQLGLLGTKADLSGLTATWPAYFSMLVLVVGIGGMLMLPFIGDLGWKPCPSGRGGNLAWSGRFWLVM